jgi:dehydrogenase/reductase SDR family member 7B
MQVYWITGASSGIGEALARELAHAGYQLILSARNESRLEKLRSELPCPDQVKILPFDLADTTQSASLVQKATAFFGQIDVIILNAGLAQRSLAQETDFEVYRKLMDVNYFGNISLAHALLPYFLKRNQGQFVVITSLVGKFGTPYRSGYAASKHALHGHFDSLRAEMMMQNKSVDITLICPGFVATKISYNALGSEGQATHVYDETNAQGLAPHEFAKKAVTVIKDRKYEAYIGGKETKGVLIKRLFPNFFARKISKARVR